MWGALTVEHWMRALAAAVLLALGVAVLAGRRASRLRLPFVALCVSLFSWNLSSLAYQLTRHREFHALDRALSPLTVATALPSSRSTGCCRPPSARSVSGSLSTDLDVRRPTAGLPRWRVRTWAHDCAMAPSRRKGASDGSETTRDFVFCDEVAGRVLIC
ncbi:MAG: hypothetical protein MUE69_26825 [Myxococcota bacterium]|jgi:hypothetical protein|nr:hypothetical protein [Myxococcota bacterium]